MKQLTTTARTGELLSALADGHLTGDEHTVAMEACRQEPVLLATWNAYQVIGDVLRASTPIVQGADLAFVERVRQRLAVEGLAVDKLVSVDLERRLQPTGPSARVLSQVVRPQVAANDGNFRWKMVAGVASVAAVCAIAWSSFGALSPASGPQLALDAGNEQVLVASPQGPMVRDVRLEELLAAHKQLGSPSAVQMPAGFLRNAAFETSQNGGR